MSEKKLLSFIIPVYNVEKYLNECLDSVFDPSVSEEEYEVIAIDDGSTDGSPDILKTYLHHRNFRVITQKNSGQSVARNVGIKAAHGVYLHFVDSDDFLVPGAVPVLLSWARQSDCDIIEFDNQTTDDRGNPIGELRSTINRTPNEGMGRDIFAEWHRQGAFFDILCIRLCKREFIINNSLFFLTGILYEDSEWQFRCFFLAEQVIYHPGIIYSYRRWTGSSSAEIAGLRRCRYYLKVIDSMASFRETIEANSDNAGYLAVQGDYISSRFESMVNSLYKSPDLRGNRRNREEIFNELKKRRYMLGFARRKKGRLLYWLTCWMPVRAAFRIYKIS